MYTIKKLTKKRRPSLPFKELTDLVLGKKYELSVVFASGAKMKNLNLKYRKKNKAADVLSFPITKNEGEIFLNSDIIKSNRNKCAHLFIHGMLHLIGFKHSSKMESEEQKVLRRFGFTK